MGAQKPRTRLFVDADLVAGARLVLAPAQTHYATAVMRLKPGDGVLVFNGRDGEWRATLDAAGKRACALSLAGQVRPQTRAPDMWLAFAPIKKNRLDFMVEKATELGVSRLIPVFTRHTDAARVNLGRLRANAVEAAEQCLRLTVPETCDPLTLDGLTRAWPQSRRLFVLDETGGGAPLAEAFLSCRGRETPAPVGFLVGPEGGFQRAELDALLQLPFVRAIGLGPRVLRAETAAVAVLACWQAMAGDWRMGRRR